MCMLNGAEINIKKNIEKCKIDRNGVKLWKKN